MSKFITLNFWFSHADLLPAFFYSFFALSGLMILLAIATGLVVRQKKGSLKPWWSRALRKSIRMFTYMGVIGAALVFFNYEGAPYISSRFVFALWLAGIIAWVIHIVYHVKNRYPQDLAQYQQGIYKK